MNTKAPPLVEGAEGGTDVVFPRTGGSFPFPGKYVLGKHQNGCRNCTRLVMARCVRWLGDDQVHLVEHGAWSHEEPQLVGITHYVDLSLIS